MLKQGSHFFFTGTFFRHRENGNGVDATENSTSKNAEPHNGLSTKSNSFSSGDDDDDDDDYGDDELSGSEKLLDNDKLCDHCKLFFN